MNYAERAWLQPSEQEREYDNILDEIRFLQVEIEVTL